MTRLPVLSIVLITLAAAPAFFLTTTCPAVAQDTERGAGEADISDSRLRDLLQNWLQDRPDRRDMILDLIQERQDRRDDLTDLLQERMDRRGEVMDFLRDHPWLRERLRGRLASRWNDEEDGGGWRGAGVQERLGDHLGGGCYFLTRSLRNQDGSLLVMVRRRICRD